MSPGPAFRHDPTKSVLALPGADHTPSWWTREPVVCGHFRMSYENKTLGRTIPVPISATPAVITGVGVVVGGFDGHVRLFDRALSKVYWTQRLDSPIYASLVLDMRRQRVVVVATSGLVVCFDLRGKPVWSAKTDCPVYATPTLLAETLVIAGFQSRCVGLRLDTGERVFDRDLPRPWHAAHGGTASHRDPYASPVTTDAGTAIVCCAEHVICFAPDGTELWRQEIGHAIKASPVAVHETGEVVVSPVDGRCLFLDGRTGESRGAVCLDAKIIGSPAISGTVLAVGTQRDTVAGLDVRARDVVWTVPQGAPKEYTSFTVLPDGNFVATAARGNVICLRRDDGRFLWESSQVLGLTDHEPAMDITPMAGLDGSMYCASYSGSLYHFRFQPADEEGLPCP